MSGLCQRAAIASGLAAALVGCAGGTRPSTTPAPAAKAAGAALPGGAPANPAPPLPPIPHVVGPIAITVVYPRPEALIESRDSNFILGSVGTGDATLTINGYPVAVRPNGAFLGWLPVPDSATSRYDFVAVTRSDTARLSYPIRLLPLRRTAQDTATSDSLAEARRPFPDSGHLVALAARDTTLPDTDRTVIVRPIPGGTYKWFLLPGTVLEVTGRSPGYERVRLDAALEAWVAVSDIRPFGTSASSVGLASARQASQSGALASLPLGISGLGATALTSVPPRRVVGAVRVVPAHDWVDVIFTMGERPPYLIEENGSDLDVTFYSTQASTDLIQYVGRLSEPPGPPDTLVRSVTWSQVTSDRAHYTIHLSQASYGYLVLWTTSGVVLRVRRSPTVDPNAPLRGLTIVVDAGHPPGGSTGPTGLYEPVATLAVAQQLKTMLEARGAVVLMTRTTPDAVGLGVRPVAARRVNASAMVSIHLNALPDGMNPYVSHGTGTYFFHPHSLALARAAQTGMVRSMGLRDLGVHYDNLAVVRPTWMPAILCEGAFVILPEQEAALRTPAFQSAYARGVADGLETFFRGLARVSGHGPPPPTSPGDDIPAPVPPTPAAGAGGGPASGAARVPSLSARVPTS